MERAISLYVEEATMEQRHVTFCGTGYRVQPGALEERLSFTFKFLTTG